LFRKNWIKYDLFFKRLNKIWFVFENASTIAKSWIELAFHSCIQTDHFKIPNNCRYPFLISLPFFPFFFHAKSNLEYIYFISNLSSKKKKKERLFLNNIFKYLIFYIKIRVKYIFSTGVLKILFFNTWVSMCIIDGTSILEKDQISTSAKFSVKNLTVCHVTGT
jgi:hypothetical protein